jgi:dimethylargininase
MNSPRPVAVIRAPSTNLGRCELTHLDRQTIDVAVARLQHAAYEEALARCGYEVIRLPEAPDLPDAVFVEDTAVVVDEVAVLTRPGAESRRPEVASVAAVLARWRPLAHIEPPATLDGGDVLRVGRTLWVGQSSRTGRAGLEQLADILSPHGYDVRGLAVEGCLHLKSAVTAVADDVVLVNPAWVGSSAFEGFDVIEVDPSEPHAANALVAGGRVIFPTAFPLTATRLAERGFGLERVDVSELAKAEGAVTCCSLLVE